MHNKVEITSSYFPIQPQVLGERRNVRNWMFGDLRERKIWKKNLFGSLGTVATGTLEGMNQCHHPGTVAIGTSDVMSPQEIEISDETGMIAGALAGIVMIALEETGMIGSGGTGMIALVVIETGTGTTVLAAEMNAGTLTGVFVFHLSLVFVCKE